MRPAWLLLVASAAAGGCSDGSGGPEALAVAGKVTFQAQPVAAGTVTFEETTKGFAGSGDIANGAYALTVPAGDYLVTVTPPKVTVPDSEITPGGEEYAEVHDIPKAYWASSTTPITLKVTPQLRAHDLDLKP